MAPGDRLDTKSGSVLANNANRVKRHLCSRLRPEKAAEREIVALSWVPGEQALLSVI
jgi:hypothetical protein